MLKNKKLWQSVVCLLLVACLCLSLAACGCSNNPPAGPSVPSTPTSETEGKTEYTVTVKNGGGQALEGIGVYIYTDDTLDELVTFAKTDAEGKITFSEVSSDKYVAVLQNLPTGYAAEDFYALTGELTQIVLTAAQAPTDGQEITYKLGDMVMDFNVTAPDGTKYTLSELLKQKDAVVLNFWYTKCDPCKMEFPYLQQAYEVYSDEIAVLALNPVDQDDAAIAAFQKDNGLTFPMAKVDAKWVDMMNITAYPTTVVIDRFGNITLVHTGAITDAQTFMDAFAYFSADDYEQKFIQDIAEIESAQEEGTAENPFEFGGVTKYEVTVKPGQVVYINAYRVNEMYMQIRNEDAYVIFNGKTYEASSGSVGLVLYCEDTNTPAKLAVGNSSDKTQTFTITLSPLAGSFNNPYELELGVFTAKVSSGNEQGVYYSFEAAEDGILTMQCLSATANVDYDYTLYNLDSYAFRTMSGESEADQATGSVSVSMPAKKGETVLFSIGTLPDSDNNYPSGVFELKATFSAGALDTEEQIEKITYTVTVTDEAGTPMAGVNVYLSGNEQSVSLKTDETGVATAELPKGEYTGKLTIPADYTLEINEFKLTEKESATTVQLTKKVVTTIDYVVKIVDTNGNPVSDVVLIMGDGFDATNADGIVTFNLLKDEYQVEVFEVPEGYILPADRFAFEKDAYELTITLAIQEPLDVYLDTSMSFTTESIAAGMKQFYNVYGVGGMILTINDSDAYVIYNDVTYGANANGIVEVAIANGMPREPSFLKIGNGGNGAAETYKVQFNYPVGNLMNPQILNSLGTVKLSLAEGNDQGYYLQWTAEKKGTVSFNVSAVSADAVCDIMLSNSNTNEYPKLSESDNGVVSMDVNAGDVITIQAVILPDENFHYPAAEITLVGSFEEYVPVVPPTEPPVTEPPATEPPATEPPATEPPATEPPATEPPATEPPATEPPATEPPATEPPATEPPATEPPATEPPATEPEEDTTPVDVFLDENLSFTTESIAAGKKLYYNVYRVGGMILTINDSDAYVIYNEVTYGANSDGVVEVAIARETPIYPTYLEIGNAGSGAAEAYKVQFSYPVGSMDNPQVLSGLGIIKVVLEEGNDQGYFLQWRATKKGTVSFGVIKATDDVEYDVRLNSTGSSEYPQLSDSTDGVVSIDVVAGDVVTIVVGTNPDADFNFPAAEITLVARFEEYVPVVPPTEPTVPPTEPPTEPTVPPTEPPTEPTVPPTEPPTEPTVPPTEPPTEPTVPPTEPPTEPTVPPTEPPTEPTVPPTEPPTEPTVPPTEPPVDTKIEYKVSLLDKSGNPYQTDVLVRIKDGNGNNAYQGRTSGGAVTVKLEPGNYTVVLTLNDSTLGYDENAAVLSADAPSITLTIAPKLSDATIESFMDINHYILQEGSTNVKLGNREANYSQQDGVDYNFFAFKITKPGVYSFTTSSKDAVITNWGLSDFFATNMTTEEEYAANKIVVTLKKENFGDEGDVKTAKFAVKINSAVTSTNVIVTYEGEVQLSPEEAADWVNYVPEGKFEKFQLPTGVDYRFEYMNIKAKTDDYKLVYNEKDGYYHLDKEDGPVVYVNLGTSAPYLSLKAMIATASIRAVIYDDNGVFVAKEDYTECIGGIHDGIASTPDKDGYTDFIDPKYHVYPLTKDLKHILESACEYLGWAREYGVLYDQVGKNINPEIAWMFACCYVPE